MFWLRNKKIKFKLRSLNLSPALLVLKQKVGKVNVNLKTRPDVDPSYFACYSRKKILKKVMMKNICR